MSLTLNHLASVTVTLSDLFFQIFPLLRGPHACDSVYLFPSLFSLRSALGQATRARSEKNQVNIYHMRSWWPTLGCYVSFSVHIFLSFFRFSMSQRDRNICRWLEESDSDAEDQRDEPKTRLQWRRRCIYVTAVFIWPLDHVIESECQSDSEIDVDELCENNDNDDGDVPVDDQSSVDDVPLARYRNYFGKNRFRWSSQIVNVRGL